MELITYIKKLISQNIEFIKIYQNKHKQKEDVVFMTNIYDETKKDNKRNILFKLLSLKMIIFLFVVLIGLAIAVFTISVKEDENIVETAKPDTTDSLMITFAEVAGLSDLAITQEQTLWTAQDATLTLSNAKTIRISYESKKKIEKFFENDGWVNELGDFNYVSKDGRGGIGYIAPKDEDYRFKSAMCIIYSAENKISCGWMPTK